VSEKERPLFHWRLEVRSKSREKYRHLPSPSQSGKLLSEDMR
jgi:hypothetical protein